jgi:hypothetical protein
MVADAELVGHAHAAVQSIATYNLTYAGKPICLRRLLSNADSGTKRRSRLT